MSVATGVIVTRSTSEGDVGNDLVGQLSQHREALRIGGGALIALCFVPGMPKMPFLVAGGFLLFASTRSTDESAGPAHAGARAVPLPAAGGLPPDGAQAATDPISDSLKVDPLELMLAPDLVDLVDPARGGDLLDRVRALRRKTALDLGLVLPPVRTRDGGQLPPGSYEIRIGRVPVATGEAPSGHLLAIGTSASTCPDAAPPSRSSACPRCGCRPSTGPPPSHRGHPGGAGGRGHHPSRRDGSASRLTPVVAGRHA